MDATSSASARAHSWVSFAVRTYAFGLAISRLRKRMSAVIELYRLAPSLDVAPCREDAAREKPAPDLYLAAATALGVPTASGMAVEGSARDIAAAREAEMFVLGFSAGCVSDLHRPRADAQVAGVQGLGLSDLEALWAARTLS